MNKRGRLNTLMQHLRVRLDMLRLGFALIAAASKGDDVREAQVFAALEVHWQWLRERRRNDA